MNISFEGIGQNVVTFMCEDDVKGGCAVKVSSDKTAAKCEDGDIFAGIACCDAEGGAAAVVIGGYVTVPYTGAAPAYGYVTVAADATGGVKTADNGRNVIVCEIDTANSLVGMFI